MSKIIEDQKQEEEKEKEVRTLKWQGLVIEDEHDTVLNNNEEKNGGMDNNNQNNLQTKRKIEENCQIINNDIQNIESKINIITKEYNEKLEFIQGVLDEAEFNHLYLDIDINPEKYLNNKRKQINALAKLVVDKKSLQNKLNAKRQELKKLQNLIKLLNFNATELLKEIRFIQNRNDQFLNENKELTVQADTLSNQFEEIKQKIKVVDVIVELKKRIQDHTNGI